MAKGTLWRCQTLPSRTEAAEKKGGHGGPTFLGLLDWAGDAHEVHGSNVHSKRQESLLGLVHQAANVTT